ncbi:hypothetical protein JCM6882_000433 [Rhodosporidiobolus microsporus]
MNSASSSQWPSVGTIFPSVESFKLSCFEQALEETVELVVDVGSDLACDLRCRLRSDSTASQIGRSSFPCTFSLHASGKGANAALCHDREVRVHKTWLVHSCDPYARRKRAGEAKQFMTGRVAAVKEQVEGLEASSDAEEEDEDEDADAAQEAPGERNSAKKAMKRMRRSGRQSSDEDSDNKSDDSDDASFSGRTSSRSPPFPSARQLTRENEALLAAGPVSFPSSASFPSARDLLINLHAYAQQRHFTLFRTSNSSETNSLTMRCSRAHYRFHNTAEGRCEMFVEAKKGENGKWAVSSKSRKHNHPLGSSTLTPVKEEQPKLAKRSRRSLPVTPPTVLDQYAKPSSPYLSPPAAATGLRPSAPSTFPHDLDAFLLSLFPALETVGLAQYASLLLSTGLSSLDDLAALLFLEDSTTALFVEEVRRMGTPADRCEGLRDMIQVLRAGPS